ncbi:Carbon monoxide dehydrogenase medium chain [Roseovarius litorisediminis]|uniref:Carbon monoxide dehydrogenase medium chain n=1 Tax=Roseovarius litorisediminis TaxID=1312363 RepID=A0A1Y5R5R2_9RHOB|nr:xanthine dehydrogenase family protein subunit M [Roseovarius litorisediminis]SLN09597.1 Carbon monoxide dehydrogenase medium chain [Roseovarius litorisediminis]
MRYVKPENLKDASALIGGEEGISRILAGGTDVLVQLKAEMVEPDLIVDVKHLDGMREIVAEDGGYRIGAAVSGAELGEHTGVKALWPGVVEAMELIGSTQVQGRATMVGNLCNGSPAADSVPAMVAADAVARIHGLAGERDIPVLDIPTGPGRTSLAKGDIITSVFLPARPDHASDAYLRFIPRTEMDIAVASAGVSLELDADGTCRAARVALGAVAPTVVLVEAAGAALVGTKLDDAAIAAMVQAAEATCNPISDKRGTVEYRTKTAGVLAKRATLIAYARAGGQK